MISQKGQALIESIMGLSATALFVLALLFGLGAIQNSMVVRRSLYEAAICSQLYPTPPDCERQAKTAIENGLIGSRLEQFQFRKFPYQVEAVAHLSTPFSKNWLISEIVHTPLSAEGGANR